MYSTSTKNAISSWSTLISAWKQVKKKNLTISSGLNIMEIYLDGYLHFQRFAPQRWKDAVRPVVGGHVQTPEHLSAGDGLPKE